MSASGRVVFWVFALVLAALFVVRLYGATTVLDWRGGVDGDSHGERTWFAWAWGEDSWQDELATVLGPVGGGRGTLDDLPRQAGAYAQRTRADWAQVMLAYHRPDLSMVWGEGVGGERVDIRSVAPRSRAVGWWTRVMVPTAWGATALLLVLLSCVLVASWIDQAQPLWLVLALGLVAAATTVLIVTRLLAAAGWWLGPWSWSMATLVGLAVWSRARQRAAGKLALASDASSSHGTALVLGTGIVVVFGLGLKLSSTPLWSWDHFAIWGLKARQLAVAGVEAPFLVDGGASNNPQYPFGLPGLWAASWPWSTLPGEPLFEVWHLLLTAVLLALVAAWGRASRARGEHVALGIAWCGLQPLIWDTEQVGVAETSLAVWAAAALVFWRLGGRHRFTGLCALAGVLAFLKDEGTPLAILLVGTVWLIERTGVPVAQRSTDGDRGRGLVALVVLIGIARALSAAQPSGVSFVAGDMTGRLGERLAHPSEVLIPVLQALAEAEWLGAWWLALPIVVLAIVRRQWMALGMVGVTLGQLGVYVAVYFVTYLDPAAHILSSFRRVSSVLVVFLLLAILELAGSIAKNEGAIESLQPD